MGTEIPNGPYILCGGLVGGISATSTAEREEEILKVSLIDDTKQKGYLAFEDICDRYEVEDWKYKGMYGLHDTEEMSCGDDNMLSREEPRISSLRDQTVLERILWDTCRGCKREGTSTGG